MNKAMVVLSGGQDSVTCLAWAKQNFDEVHAITFNYNQRHSIEIQAAQNVVKLLGGITSHEIIDVGPILAGRSPLTNPQIDLELYQNYEQMDKTIGDRTELTFVPMRNALFLTLAANRAICKDIYEIITGVCQADNANYPDCRKVYIDVQEDAINKALGLDKNDLNCIGILTPLMDMSKAESINLATSIPGAYELLAFSHTAYDGQYPPVGSDHATTLRAHGFEEAGLPDPLVVRAWSEKLMPLPTTENYADVEQVASLAVVIKSMSRRLV